MSPSPQQPQSQQQSLAQQTTAEWVSLIVVLGTLSILTYFYFFQSGQQQPARTVQPRLDQLAYKTNAYYQPVEVHNNGRQTASAKALRSGITPFANALLPHTL